MKKRLRKPFLVNSPKLPVTSSYDGAFNSITFWKNNSADHRPPNSFLDSTGENVLFQNVGEIQSDRGRNSSDPQQEEIVGDLKINRWLGDSSEQSVITHPDAICTGKAKVK